MLLIIMEIMIIDENPQTSGGNFYDEVNNITPTNNKEMFICRSRCGHCVEMCCGVCTKTAVKCQVCCVYFLSALLIVICLSVRAAEIIEQKEPKQGSYSIGTCKIASNEPCPYPDIKFYLYTRKRPEYPQPIKIGDTIDNSNITKSDFDYRLPTKIIIHGYNSNMFLDALVEIKRQYLRCCPHNIFAVDWESLAPAPCYITAIYNIRQVGKCAAQLVQRIRDLGATDIHVIGFSLGAHVTNYIAQELNPYKLPRISGLDPAMPGFTFVGKDSKLDASDAEFVDVFHTNAFIQGTIQSSGHVDFYINGGVVQPGCWAEHRFFACNHHRAPLYFAESITSNLGFWGWPCSTYFMYLIGQCPPKEPQILAGESVNKTARGIHLVITSSVSPFAVGKYTGPAIEILRNESVLIKRLKSIAKFKNEIITECVDADGFLDNITPSSVFEDDIRINTIFR